MKQRQHTTLNLNMELVNEARSVLGTEGTTETVHRALKEVIDREKRKRLLGMGIGSLTPEALEQIRRVRTFEESDASTLE